MANSSSNSLSRGKILSALCLIIFALLFIFSCLSKSITLGAKIVGTFGVISYPLFLGMALLCLFKFLGFSYKRSIKATVLMFCFIYALLAVIHSIRTFSMLESVASSSAFNDYLNYSYSHLTVLGSIGCLLCGAVAYVLGAVGTIIVFVILGTLSIGLFIDFELYGKYDEKHIKKLKSRKLREKVLNSGNDLTEDGTPSYSFSNDLDKYTDKDVVAEVSDDLKQKDYNNLSSYSDDDVVAETTDGNYYSNNFNGDLTQKSYSQNSFNQNSEKNDISPNYFGANFYNQNYENYQTQNNGFGGNYSADQNYQNMFGADSVTPETQNSFSNDVYKEPDYPDVYDENEQRRQFMRATFSSEPDGYSNNYSDNSSYYGGDNQSLQTNQNSSGSSYGNFDNSNSSDLNSNYSENQSNYNGMGSGDYSNSYSSSSLNNDGQYDLNNLYKNYNDNDPYSFSLGHDNNIDTDNFNQDNLTSQNSSNSNDFSSNSVDNKISEILGSGNDQADQEEYKSLDDKTSASNSNDSDSSKLSFLDDEISKSAENDIKSNFSFDNDKPIFSEQKNDDFKDFDNSNLSDTFKSPIDLNLPAVETNSNNQKESDGFGESIISSSESKIKIPAKDTTKKFNMSMGGMKYVAPPTSLLKTIVVDNGNYDEEQSRKAKKLEEVLAAFNITVSVTNIVRGPKITRYELSVPLGVSIKKIPSYELDIKKSLAAKTVNIQAPIPGSEFVGIELENDTFTNVGLKELLESDNFKNFSDPLPIAIGKDISGEIVVKSLAKMVHMLIAGQTGSGKSVFIHNIILSLIYKYSPDDLRLMLIDPKRVEFNRYNGLPHLVTPEVVLGTEKAVNALKWCVSEMDRRFNLMEKVGYNNIVSYNNSELVKSGQFPRFPYIVIVLDEFAEVIMANKKDTEACIQRITQLARACGMHLILATQRPSVDVISGVIKNNVPSRVAFSLASAFDSKTILDRVGAENLLGQGDMLFSPNGTSVVSRLQAAYCSDEEIASVVSYVKEHNQSNYDDSVAISINSPLTKTADSSSGGSVGMPPEKEVDDYFVLALKLFIQRGEASASYLQRRLSIGYGRSSRIMDQLESKGYIAPTNGAKVRKVLITAEQFKEKFGEDVNDTSNNF